MFLHQLYEMVTGPITRGARFLLVGSLDVWFAIGSEPQVLLLLLPLMYGFELIVSPTPREKVDKDY
jgi:hypothetical protein